LSQKEFSGVGSEFIFLSIEGILDIDVVLVGTGGQSSSHLSFGILVTLLHLPTDLSLAVGDWYPLEEVSVELVE